MLGVHMFQRFSQKENVVTNNTLLFLSRLYNYSPGRFQGFLREVLQDDQLNVGIAFHQQVREGMGSVPDGRLGQDSLKVLVETKLSQNYSKEQLLNHMMAFSREGRQYLMLLGPTAPKHKLLIDLQKDIAALNKKNGTHVVVSPITFEQLIECYDSVLLAQDFEMKDLVEEFKAFCAESKLLPVGSYTMRAVVCSKTLQENQERRVYYDSISRTFREHDFIGLYADKRIRAIGKISNIIHAEMEGRELKVREKLRTPTEAQLKTIREIIPVAEKNNGYQIATGHNFFLVDQFFETDYLKATKNPIQGPKYFDLREVLGRKELPGVEEIATLMKDKRWE